MEVKRNSFCIPLLNTLLKNRNISQSGEVIRVVTNLQEKLPEGLGWDFNVVIWDGGNTGRKDHFILWEMRIFTKVFSRSSPQPSACRLGFSAGDPPNQSLSGNFNIT
jgi:hypothetical protein